MKKILIFLGIVLFLFLLICWFRPTRVIDAATNKPVTGASVSYAVSNWANGCGNETTKPTNSFGVASFGGILFPCQVTITKEGYHQNGSNDPRELKSFLGVKSITINQIEDPQEPVVFDRVFTKSRPGMDVLSYLQDLDPNVSPENLLGDKNLDFSFTTISNSEVEKNVMGQPILYIHFNGEGGVQPIGNNASPQNDAGKLYYDLENLLVAPDSGYSQDLSIEAGRSYIARLSDGKHYMKFHVFGSKTDGESYACMTAFVQPKVSSNVEFNNIFDNRFCSSDKNPLNYDLKQKYLEIKKAVDGEHTVRLITKRYPAMNIESLYTQESDDYHYYFFFVDNGSERKPLISTDALLGRVVVLKVPPFEQFSKLYDEHGSSVPVNVYWNDKYVDPATLY